MTYPEPRTARDQQVVGGIILVILAGWCVTSIIAVNSYERCVQLNREVEKLQTSIRSTSAAALNLNYQDKLSDEDLSVLLKSELQEPLPKLVTGAKRVTAIIRGYEHVHDRERSTAMWVVVAGDYHLTTTVEPQVQAGEFLKGRWGLLTNKDLKKEVSQMIGTEEKAQLIKLD